MKWLRVTIGVMPCRRIGHAARSGSDGRRAGSPAGRAARSVRRARGGAREDAAPLDAEAEGVRTEPAAGQPRVLPVAAPVPGAALHPVAAHPATVDVGPVVAPDPPVAAGVAVVGPAAGLGLEAADGGAPEEVAREVTGLGESGHRQEGEGQRQGEAYESHRAGDCRATAGISTPVDKVVTIRDVRTFETRSGNQRYVLRDEDGDEYTTFRESIGEAAKRLEGRRARIEYHETQRGEYTNVYLDGAEAAPDEPAAGGGAGTDPDEAAWRTAVDAAPGWWARASPRGGAARRALREAEALPGAGGGGHQGGRGG